MNFYKYIKVIIDIILSIVLSILLAPIITIIAVMIKIESKGPIIFRQRRLGKNKKEFYIYKFRTMRIDTPNDMPTHMLSNPETYITRLGKLLRKSSLDELPQVFNVLRGEMSFIGPRPALWNQYDLIEERDKAGANNIKPGITGWAQVNGRDEIPIEIKVRYDAEYAKHISFLWDIEILLKTVVNVLAAKGVLEGSQSSERNLHS